MSRILAFSSAASSAAEARSQAARVTGSLRYIPCSPGSNVQARSFGPLGVGGDISGGPGFHAGRLQEPEVAEPVDEALVPGPEGRAQPVGQAGGGAAAGVMAVAVDV